MGQVPLELVDQSIGSNVWVVLKNKQEFSGVLLGFDDFVNVVLGDVTEYADGETIQRSKVLLHGKNVAMIIPGKVDGPGGPRGVDETAA